MISYNNFKGEQMIEFGIEEHKKESPGAKIKVMGLGGGGSNAVHSMVGELENVKLIVANTDAQVLELSDVDMKLHIGKKLTKGLGAGANPDIGRRAAEEDLQSISDAIADADILFLTAGLGGGTGTGATPVIAHIAREMGILTIAIVTTPFMFEGRKREKQAEAALEILKKEVDTLIVIPNQKLLELVDPKISMLDAFALVNNVLKQAIKGVADIITKPGHINVDFADVRSVMKGMGMAIMGTGRARGEGRAKQAALDAICSPLLENISIKGAQGVLINIAGDSSLGLYEINDAVRVVYDAAGDDANIIFGSVIDQSLGDEVTITIIASGFDRVQEKEPQRSYQQEPQKSSSHSSYHRADIPYYTVKKNHDEQTHSMNSAPRKNYDSNLDVDVNDLDAPTYLRKKVHQEEQGD